MTKRRMLQESAQGPRFAVAIVCLLLMLTSTRARAQDPPPVLDTVRVVPCLLGCDTVRGLVFDSLAGQPLTGAIVVARPGGVTVTTDSLGRFTLVHDGPATQLTAYHTELDQMGLGALVLERPARAATWRNAQLTTPSLLTLWPKLCRDRRPVGLRAVILTGTARLADGVTRVAGAKILVQWPPPPYSIGASGLRSAETFTDSLGNYLVCGVEEFVEPSLLALSAEAQSSVITVPMDARPLRRIDLVLGRTGAQATTASVHGRVVDSAGQPVAGMRVSIDGHAEELTTGTDGQFTFPAVPVGSRMLMARAIGYTPIGQVVEVMEGDNAPLTIPMDKVFMLDGVVVTAKTVVRRDRQEFEMRRRSGLGRFIDSSDIRKAPHLRAVLAMTPGIMVASPHQQRPRQPPNIAFTPNGPVLPNSPTTRPSNTDIGSSSIADDFVVSGRNGCRAIIWVDGVVDNSGLATALPKNDIVAIEVYPSAALAPGRFIVVGADTARSCCSGPGTGCGHEARTAPGPQGG